MEKIDTLKGFMYEGFLNTWVPPKLRYLIPTGSTGYPDRKYWTYEKWKEGM